jgi:hypothetical protein
MSVHTTSVGDAELTAGNSSIRALFSLSAEAYSVFVPASSLARSRVLLAGIIATLASFAALLIAAAPASAEPNALGMNLDSPMDWLPQRMFADAMKTSRTLKRIGSTSKDPVDVALDARGYPKEDFEIGFWFDPDRMNGNYKLSFKGRADIEVWEHGTIELLSYNPATNTTSATLVIPTRGHAPLVLRFRNTRRGPRSTTSDGLTDIKLMRPIAEGSTRSYDPGTLLTSQFVHALKPFSVLRYNGFAAGDYGEVVEWKDRALPGPSLNRPMSKCSHEETCWEGQGGPWEYVILASNELHKDAWITIPMHVSDDYVRNLALLFRDGNELTGGKGLDPSLHLYLEYGNEMWNWGYHHTKDNAALAKSEYAHGDPYHYGQNTPNTLTLRTARRIAEMGRIFRAVFGDAAMMTRVRPLLEWDSRNLVSGLEPLIYLEDRYIPACVSGALPAITGVPRCSPGTKVSDLLYGGGGSAYFYTNDDQRGITLENVWTNADMDPEHWGKAHQIANSTVAHTFGLRRIAYEGGPHFNVLLAQDAQGHHFGSENPGCPSDVARMAAWSDPRMKSAVLAHHAAWSRWGGDLVVYSGFAGGNEFGFIHDVLDIDAPKLEAVSPKMSALFALAGQERARVELGHSVPGTAEGKAFDLGFRNWYKPGAGSLRIADGEWSSYLFNVASDGWYEVGASFARGTPGHAVLLVDGDPVRASANDASLFGDVRLAPGLHAVRVRAKGGDLTLKSVSLALPSQRK